MANSDGSRSKKIRKKAVNALLGTFPLKKKSSLVSYKCQDLFCFVLFGFILFYYFYHFIIFNCLGQFLLRYVTPIAVSRGRCQDAAKRIFLMTVFFRK